MGIVTPANNWTVGLSKNTGAAEGVVPTVAAYKFPVYSGTPNPVQTTTRIEVTDAASVVGDPVKQSGEHWESTVVLPAFANVLGLALLALYPTDTPAGAGTAITKTITAATQSAGTVTFTAAAHGFSNGNSVFVTGMTPATYNGYHLVANVATDTFDVVGFSSSLTSPATAFGTVVRPPYNHIYTGLGNTQGWFSMYSTAPGSQLQTFEDGICSGLSFDCDETGGPMKLQFSMVGKKPTKVAHTVTTSAALTDGFFTMTAGTIRMDEDSATPGAVTNVQKATVNIDRPATALATADGVSVSNISQGKVDPTFKATMFYSSWDAFNSTFYGSASGSAPSSTLVGGSLSLLFVHSIQSTWAFSINVPSAVFIADPPQPDPGGGPLTVQINGYAKKPSSGDHVVPILGNNVATY